MCLQGNGSYDEVYPWESRKPVALGRYTVFCTNPEFRWVGARESVRGALLVHHPVRIVHCVNYM